jgi:hypothetical protein
MTDWATIASFATAGGTLVLAVATFSSIRAAQRAALTAELARQETLRPVLMSSQPQDAPENVFWPDGHVADFKGGQAILELTDQTIYAALSLHNIGPGLAVLHGWYIHPQWQQAAEPHPKLEDFRPQRMDLYVRAGGPGLWQGAIRDSADADYQPLIESIKRKAMFTIDVLYGDHTGGQRSITRFGIAPRDGTEWLASVVRHWNIDRPDPRSLQASARLPT